MPELLILDEPSAALTDIEVEGLFAIMQKLIGEGKSIIFISHKMREVLHISDRITVLRLGEVVGTVARADTDGQKLANMMIGKELTESQYEKVDASGAEVVASLDHVDYDKEHKHSGVNDMTLQIRSGEIVGIAGVDGNGQTQLAQLITGVIVPQGGKIYLKDRSVAVFDPHSFITDGVSHVPEDRNAQGLVGDMSIAENLVLKETDSPKFSQGKGLRLNKRAIHDYAEEMVQKYDVRCTSVRADGPAACPVATSRRSSWPVSWSPSRPCW
ncbi:MAG: ATP-binding cassette domain-containing protein [Lachnospiraceae bacterium]